MDASSDPDRSGSRLGRPARSIPALKRIIVMSYAIIGFGSIGQALAGAFARNNIAVTVASRRPPEALLPQAQAIGPKVIPRTLQEAAKADVIILDRKSVGQGKRVSVRVDLGGRRTIKKKKKKT